MKKAISFILALVMVMSLVACGAKEEPAPEKEETKTETPAPEKEPEKEPELNFPTKNITIIVPYSAGGGADLMSRAVADELSKRLGVAVTVEDNPGGSGGIGMSLAAAAEADGHTLVMAALGGATLTPHLNDVGYSPADFTPICQLSESVTVFCVNKSSGITTIEELIEAGKANPGALTYGTAGAGGPHHIAVAGLGIAAANDPDLFTHVPYSGGVEAVTAVLGGHDTFCSNIYAEPSGYIQSGDFVPLLTIANERPEYLPDTPTSAEKGWDITGGTWYGFAYPDGVDPEIVKFMEAEIMDIMSDPAMVETFTNLGNPVKLLDSAAFTEKWTSGYENAGTVLESIGMK